ncbi:aldehyde oxidase GLOX-like [Cornus florida]|uniref:aldehyde oxidase GLOX-like n=1 Tax=Cornus florida TaxID=4283 RepID=UPI002897D1E1|nr:aldehyde oxidase GLOX-like [Cornus florida]
MEQKKHFPIVFKFSVTTLYLLAQSFGFCAAGNQRGKWQVLLNSTGVVAMHMTLTHHNTVILFDKTGSGPSNYRIPRRNNGTGCTGNRASLIDSSCYAHSIEYDISGNTLRPLVRLDTDPWCSSGSFLSNGTLIQAGGYGSGTRRIRYFEPCDDGQCDWRQSRTMLSDGRWYASNLVLPEKDRVIVVGGRRVFTYEFLPKVSSKDTYSFNLPFLHQTYSKREGGFNLYPFLHLLPDGSLFIFSDRDSIAFSYKRNKVIKTFPRIPGNGSRTHPSTGSSVILPLEHSDRFQKAEVMVCGGAASGAYRAAKRGKFLEGLSSCGRMVVTGHRHKWKMENMPGPKLLNDMLILPTGHILIINGAQRGCAGYDNAATPSLHPYLYSPKKQLGRRFSILKPTRIARMYHSSAILLPDGRVLVSGSNPHSRYRLRNVTYPTELRMQAFIPHHMDSQFHRWRPSNVSIYYSNGTNDILYGQEFSVRFRLRGKPGRVVISAYAPPFTTHSISMNQRMLRLSCKNVVRNGDGWNSALVYAPPSPNVAPAGYYLLTVVNDGIPSMSQWVRFIHA